MEEKLKKQVWQRFVREGALDSSRMNKRILESWYFCRKTGVNPFDGKGAELLSLDALKEKQQQNIRLLKTASPIITNLYSLFKHTDSILLLIDPEGYVLKVAGSSSAVKYACDINFVEGVKWTEDQVGTNAIGTALRNEEAITVAGAEHYSVASQNWVCSAAPVRDESGKLIGVLDVSSRVGTCCHDHTLGAVVASAYAIEHEWEKRVKEADIELMQRALRLKDSAFPFVLCNQKGVVVHRNGSLPHSAVAVQEKINDRILEESGCTITMKLPVLSDKTGEIIGYQLNIAEKESALKLPVAWPSERTVFRFAGVKGISETFRQVLKQAEKAAASDIPVHLAGETGTGKGVLARAIHENSPRRNGPFVELNCGAIAPSLLESELFGYAPGAFTGAGKAGYKGKLAQADGGTLLLDEIGDISPAMQVALLKVLDSQQVTAVGATDTRQLNFRLITAANCDFTDLMKKGKIRQDFYYRLFVFPIKLPPLNSRADDIPYFIHWYCRCHHWNVRWPEEAVRYMAIQPWSGNVRQLFNCLDRLRLDYPALLPPLQELKAMIEQLRDGGEYHIERELQKHWMTYREEMEKKEIQKAIEAANGKSSEAIGKLAMSRSTFYRKVKKYNL